MLVCWACGCVGWSRVKPGGDDVFRPFPFPFRQAARAYDAAAKDLYEGPVLNFLPDGSLNPERRKAVKQYR